MESLFLILQVTILTLQLYALFRGIKCGDMFSREALYGLALWGCPVVIALGAISKSLGGV